jgi:hypothetical protein
MTSGIIEILIDSVTVQGLVGQNRAGTKYKVYPACSGRKGPSFRWLDRMELQFP